MEDGRWNVLSTVDTRNGNVSKQHAVLYRSNRMSTTFMDECKPNIEAETIVWKMERAVGCGDAIGRN